MPFVAVLESHARATAVCVTEVVCRFGGVVGTLVFGGGGGVVVAQGAVAPVSDATAPSRGVNGGPSVDKWVFEEHRRVQVRRRGESPPALL